MSQFILYVVEKPFNNIRDYILETLNEEIAFQNVGLTLGILGFYEKHTLESGIPLEMVDLCHIMELCGLTPMVLDVRRKLHRVPNLLHIPFFPCSAD